MISNKSFCNPNHLSHLGKLITQVNCTCPAWSTLIKQSWCFSFYWLLWESQVLLDSCHSIKYCQPSMGRNLNTCTHDGIDLFTVSMHSLLLKLIFEIIHIPSSKRVLYLFSFCSIEYTCICASCPNFNLVCCMWKLDNCISHT